MRVLAIIFVLLFIHGCSAKSKKEEAPGNYKAASETEAKQRQTNPNLAYEYTIGINSSEQHLSEDYEKLVSGCQAAQQHACRIIESSISLGSYGSAKIILRIAPEGVEPYLALAKQLGKTNSLSVAVEDLTPSIMDLDKRKALLEASEARFRELQQQKDISAEALIKITEQLVSIQLQLEDLAGDSKKTQQRIQTDLIQVNLYTRPDHSFWHPIAESLDDLADDFADGIANFITTLAYLLPWIGFIGFITWAGFKINRRRRNKALGNP